MHVPNFRTTTLYDRSLELAGEVYVMLEQYEDILDEQDSYTMRKRVVRITKKLTRSIVQHNKKMKLKLLNETKGELLLLMEQVYQLVDEQRVEDIDAYMIDNYGTQLLKLIHYQFGQMKFH